MARKDAPSIFERLQILMEDEMGPGRVRDAFLTFVHVSHALALATYLSFFQLITYGIASAGLFAALYKIKPVSRNGVYAHPSVVTVSTVLTVVLTVLSRCFPVLQVYKTVRRSIALPAIASSTPGHCTTRGSELY